MVRYWTISAFVVGCAAWFVQAEPQPPAATPPAAETDVSEAAPRPVAATPDANPSDDVVEGPITGPRDLLSRFGIDDSQFQRLTDHQPFDSDDEETTLRVMYRLDRFRLVDVEQWAARQFPIAEVFSDPAASRGKLFWLAGRVTKIEKLEPVPEVVERFDLPAFYCCTLQMEPQGQPAQVLVKDIPIEWKIKEGTLNERASAYGLFLKFAGQAAEDALPVFVAPQIAWYPPTLLGNLGMNVALFQDVQNRRPLTAQDREAFYQLLAAAGRAKPGELRQAARQALAKATDLTAWTDRQGNRRWSVVPLFNDASRQHGVLVELEGNARRVERIEVRDPDIVARFGIDHYYQIALFSPDSQSNPLWFCVRELPKDMPLGTDANYQQHVRVAGFFFKTWAYRRGRSPEEIAEGDTGPWQLAPLLIGREAVWYPSTTPGMSPYISAIAGGLFVLTLIGIWIAMWQYGRGDRAFHERAIAKEYAVQSGVSLNEMGFEATPEPDFRHLEAADPEPAAVPPTTQGDEREETL